MTSDEYLEELKGIIDEMSNNFMRLRQLDTHGEINDITENLMQLILDNNELMNQWIQDHKREIIEKPKLKEAFSEN